MVVLELKACIVKRVENSCDRSGEELYWMRELLVMKKIKLDGSPFIQVERALPPLALASIGT